jgi:heme-degrading monooxygenase HmoA
VIARLWRGKVRNADTAAYLAYAEETGVSECRGCAGNRGAWLLSRDAGDGTTEIVTLSFWASRESIVDFAGEDIEKAVFYPEDDRFLIERDLTVTHYKIAE